VFFIPKRIRTLQEVCIDIFESCPDIPLILALTKGFPDIFGSEVYSCNLFAGLIKETANGCNSL